MSHDLKLLRGALDLARRRGVATVYRVVDRKSLKDYNDVIGRGLTAPNDLLR